MVSSKQLVSGTSSYTLLSLRCGFKRVEADRSVYIYSDGHVRIFVPIYIDDITFACKDGAAIDRAVKQLATHFNAET